MRHWWGHNGLPKHIARLIQTLRLPLLWAACCICIWTGAGLQSTWTIRFNKDSRTSWLLYKPLSRISIKCTFPRRILTIRELKSLEVLAHRKNQVSVQAMGDVSSSLKDFERDRNSKKLRVAAIIDIKQSQVLKNCRSKLKMYRRVSDFAKMLRSHRTCCLHVLAKLVRP